MAYDDRRERAKLVEAATRHLSAADPILAQIIGRVGPCVLLKRDATVETLARSITFQQLQGKAAATIVERLRKAVGRCFTARGLLRLAKRVVRREIAFTKLSAMTDEEVIECLCKVRGVGAWTIQMFLMFALERPNVLPLSDLGIRSEVRKASGLDKLPKPQELASIAWLQNRLASRTLLRNEPISVRANHKPFIY